MQISCEGGLSPPCPAAARAEWSQSDFVHFQMSLNMLFLPHPFLRIRGHSAFAIRDPSLPPEVHLFQRDHAIRSTPFSQVMQMPSTPGSQDYQVTLLAACESDRL